MQNAAEGNASRHAAELSPQMDFERSALGSDFSFGDGDPFLEKDEDSLSMEDEDSLSLDTDLTNPRLISDASSPLLPYPVAGDWVAYVFTDVDGSSDGAAVRAYRMGDVPRDIPSAQWSVHVETCISHTRLGETRAYSHSSLAQPLRLRLVEHIKRHVLGSAVLDIKNLGTNMSRARAGSTVMYSVNGTQDRAHIDSRGASTVLQEALCVLKVGDEGYLQTEPDGDSIMHLVVNHVATPEDISPLADGTLWKLSLNSPDGSFECARPGNTVKSTVDGEPVSWTWGRGEVSSDVEFAALSVGCGEHAEIYRGQPGDFELLFVLRIEQIGTDPDSLASADPTQLRCCAMAKQLFDADKLLLARWHWKYAYDTLRAAHEDADVLPTSGPNTAEVATEIKILGNLSVVERRLGRFEEALRYAKRAMDQIPEEKRSSRDFMRLAHALEAFGDAQQAIDTCDVGLERPDVTEMDVKAFRSIRHNAMKRQKASLRTERDFCRRMFA